ncbi:MAG TPA: glycosyltransferase family 1 protein [Patescibacteria group bacterium]
MRIGIDVSCLGEGRRTGVEEYTLNLLQNIFKLDRKNEYILFLNSWKSSRADFSWLADYPNVKLKKFHFPNKLLNFLFWYFAWPKMDKMIGGADLFFMPNIMFGSVSEKTKLLVTIHDLSFERYPESFSLKRRLWHIFINPKKICSKASGIIVVSESTKNDLLKIYKVDPNKIKVIYSGVSDRFRVISRNDENLIRVKKKYHLPYKFILYLGTIEPRKNIIGVLRAYHQFRKSASADASQKELLDYRLVIAGSKGWLSRKIFSEIEKSEFQDSILLVNFVEDTDKEYVFNLASLFVYPSFFEGFGFPVLEAMSCGVPTIASNSSSLPEIAGEAAVLIDPDKPQEIASAMKEILTNGELRSKLIERGLVRSKEFSWQKSAREFLKIIKNLG